MNKYDYDREKERIVNGLVACIFGIGFLYMKYAAEKVKKWERKKNKCC